MDTNKKDIIPMERIENRILLIRGERVILDRDLAELYNIATKRFNEQVKRNRNRFPADFMFQLTREEKSEVVAICDHLHNLKYSPNLPFAFTEHGVIMAASVLNSDRAVEMSLYVVRVFVKLRRLLATHVELAQKLEQLERKLQTHDKQIIALFEAIRMLMAPPKTKKKKPIGYQSETE
jgi:hypothetical protein